MEEGVRRGGGGCEERRRRVCGEEKKIYRGRKGALEQR